MNSYIHAALMTEAREKRFAFKKAKYYAVYRNKSLNTLCIIFFVDL